MWFESLLFAFSLNLAAASSAPAANEPSLDKAIAAWASTGEFAAPHPIAYRVAMTDLNDDSIPDAVVLVTDRDYCGTGGCTLLVFKGTGNDFELVSESSISREPIYVLAEARHGWHTLIVTAAGGGMPEKRALMRFDGRQYPLNPSVEPPATSTQLRSARQLKLRERKL